MDARQICSTLFVFSIILFLAFDDVSFKLVKEQSTANNAKPRRRSLFSSFHCVGGSQDFSDFISEMKLQDTQIVFWPKANSVAARVCMFHDVCSVKGEILFFKYPELDALTPEFTHIEAMAKEKGLGFDGYRPDHTADSLGWMPVIMDGPIPFQSRNSYGARSVYILDRLSYAFNYAHLLIDQLYGGHMAAAIFNFDIGDAQLIGLEACENFEFTRRNALQCQDNLANWVPVLFNHPYVFLQDLEDTCFDSLVVGAGAAFSLQSLHTMRGVVFRNARSFALQKLGVLPPHIGQHHVLVFEKSPEDALRKPAYPEICSDVRRIIEQLELVVPLTCQRMGFSTLSVYEQIAFVQNATIIFTEHGSVSYTTRFAQPGLVSIHIGGADPPYSMRDAMVVLHDADRPTYFVSSARDRLDDLRGMLLVALERAGQGFNLDSPH